ncbi:hypothetical protein F5Y16DRAFT_400985 [Xylariaceae sp. FL0255]|nr:hypothetical protein F5Y16DRAFT_400985 [Xylariaceae sp. FL0255]
MASLTNQPPYDEREFYLPFISPQNEQPTFAQCFQPFSAIDLPFEFESDLPQSLDTWPAWVTSNDDALGKQLHEITAPDSHEVYLNQVSFAFNAPVAVTTNFQHESPRQPLSISDDPSRENLLGIPQDLCGPNGDFFSLLMPEGENQYNIRDIYSQSLARVDIEPISTQEFPPQADHQGEEPTELALSPSELENDIIFDTFNCASIPSSDQEQPIHLISDSQLGVGTLTGSPLM